MTIAEIIKHKGKILVKNNYNYTWMFKLIGLVNSYEIQTIYGMDIKPCPRIYNCNGFNATSIEAINESIRIPTKEELNLYRKYTREIKLLGTNKSEFGTK